MFADIVNGLVFKGKPVVSENDLVTETVRSIYKADGRNHEQERDIAKYWKKGGVIISLVGIENQSVDDPDMPLRVSSYNGAGYREQMNNDPKDEMGIGSSETRDTLSSHWCSTLELRNGRVTSH